MHKNAWFCQKNQNFSGVLSPNPPMWEGVTVQCIHVWLRAWREGTSVVRFFFIVFSIVIFYRPRSGLEHNWTDMPVVTIHSFAARPQPNSAAQLLSCGVRVWFAGCSVSPNLSRCLSRSCIVSKRLKIRPLLLLWNADWKLSFPLQDVPFPVTLSDL